jgi:hypothetical protein
VKSLKSVTDDRVRAYIVWLPIFGGDFRGEARRLANSYRDKRVSYYVDAGSLTGKVWEPVLKTERFAWDVYLLYGAAANWEQEPPSPDYWMHQLYGVTSAPRFDEATFTAKLKAMLAETTTPQLNSQTDAGNGGVKVEFLYFNDCPGHRQALANLKAALRASKIQAQLVLTKVTSERQAAEIGFQGSPSIRVSGKDMDGKNDGYAYACRVYRVGGRITGTPTKEFIREKLRMLMN